MPLGSEGEVYARGDIELECNFNANCGTEVD